MRLNYYEFPESTEPEVLKENDCKPGNRVLEGISVTTAKKMLKEHGGIAWTEHCERDGGYFEVTPITLSGNNSRFKYKAFTWSVALRIL